MKLTQLRSALPFLALGATAFAPACGSTAAAPPSPQSAAAAAANQQPERKTIAISVDAAKPLRTINKRRFLGTNIALWHQPSTYESAAVRKLMTDAGIGLIRLPGGGLSDQYFWNGNGVRKGKVIDRSKYKNNQWNIDYSGWAPGFLGFFGFPKDPAKAEIQEWQGACDVKQELEFTKALSGVEGLITVNAGTGTPRDAAEWMKWVNKNKYPVKFWEVGNELGGDWESGTVRPDGKSMDAAMYASIYEDFAKKMKAVDPNALVGSQGGGAPGTGVEFIRATLERKDAPIDFVTWHDYFNADNNPDAMFKVLDKIRPSIAEVKEAVAKGRPGKSILLGMTEFNCKLFEDENTADTNSGLWMIAAVGEMIYGGLDFATSWDAFTQKQDKGQGGGHGFIIENGAVPKAEYWTYFILNKFLGEKILDVKAPNSPVRTYASKDAAGNVYLIAVNTSQTEAFDASLAVAGQAVGPMADCVRFSEQEYVWDAIKFAPTWNNGPTPLTLRVSGAPVTLPKASATACLLKATPSASSLAVQGSTSTVLATSARSSLQVGAFDRQGHPATGVSVSAKASSGFSVDPASAKTGADGVARFTVTAPAAAAEGQLAFSADSFPALNQPLKAVQPELVVQGPPKVPAGETASFMAAARYKDGDHYKLLQTFAPGDASVVIAGGKPESVSFTGGLALLSVTSPKAAAKSIRLSASGLTGAADTSFFERVTKDLLVNRFDDAKSLENAKGKSKYRINENVKANEGVLELPIDGAVGYDQDQIILDKIDKTPNLDRANIRALTVDIMAGKDLQTGDKYAELLFVLQGELNWWMPLDKIDLSKLPKGEWKHFVLPVSKPEWQKAMRAFVKMDLVVNAGAAQKGTLYLDNLGFQLENPK